MKLRDIRTEISTMKPRSKNVVPTLSHLISYPLHYQRSDITLDGGFVKPSRVAVVGSFLIRSVAKPRVNIDLAVFLPNSIFVAKDLRDHRYTDKRNLYLSTMESVLKQKSSSLFSNMWYEALNGDKRRPVLCIGISKDQKQKKKCTVVVRVLPALDPKQCPFDPKRLDLTSTPRNNCRRRIVGDIEESQPVTPHYTNAILEDLSLEANLRALHERSKTCRAFSLACVLVKIWLRQRDLNCVADGINGFMMSMLMSHLFEDSQRVLQTILLLLLIKVEKEKELCVLT